MKSFLKCLFAVVVLLGSGVIQGQTLDKYIKKANQLDKNGKSDQAIKTMSDAIKKYPNSAQGHSYLGLFTGMQAGKTNDFMEAGRLIMDAYVMLDKAVSLDPNHPIPRFHRGLMGVNIPEFLGKLDQGINDLEILIKISKASPKKVSKDIRLNSYNLLAQGFQKKKEYQKAIVALKKVMKNAPGTDLAKKAEKQIETLSKQKEPQQAIKKKPDSEKISNLKQKTKKEPNQVTNFIELGKAYISEKNYEEARIVLKKAIQLDQKNLPAYKLLAFAIGEIASKGYDKRIYENTNFRTNLAFELSRIADQACAIAPNDIEIRLMRGIVGVEMPFFVGKLKQAIEDLNWIVKSNATDSTKAEALYWLGMAHQKQATTHWKKVVTKYKESGAVQSVFKRLRPPVKHLNLSTYQRPFLVIDFLLGFRDELPPQTAVWIENKDGSFVKSIYVSGFSGFAKEQQINLPKWSKSSQYKDVDAVTGASIDLGHHIYVWDLTDNKGKRVKPGEYIVKVEAHYWPSMEYQMVTSKIELGKKHKRIITEEGNLVPYLELKYHPSK